MKALLSIVLFLPLWLSAQFMEYGLGIGTMNYAGDLVEGYRFGYMKPAVSAHYRLNLSEIIATRFMLTVGGITGDDQNPPDVLGENRNQAFSSTIIEGAAVMEYHFLNYKNEKDPIDWSPYLFGGFGIMKINNPVEANEEFSEYQPVLPIGFGIKKKIGKQFVLEFETGARKTFFDYLDGISDGDVTNKNYQYGNPNDNDWYFFTGIRISFVSYKIPCPFQYIPNRSIYSR